MKYLHDGRKGYDSIPSHLFYHPPPLVVLQESDYAVWESHGREAEERVQQLEVVNRSLESKL
jgi:hypothetical protein